MAARNLSIVLLASSLAATASNAQEPANEPFLTRPQDRWTIRFEPSLLYGAPGGELTLPGAPAGTPETELGDIDLDKPRVSPYFELHYKSGDWRVTASSFIVSLDEVGKTISAATQLGPLALSPGDRLVSSMDIAMGELIAAKHFGGPKRFDGVADPDFALGFEALGGVRFYHVDFDFTAPAGSVSADEFFIHPIAGIKATMNILERVDIDLQVICGGLPTGGDRSSFSIEILNGYTYRPIENVGVQIGYRLSFYSLSSGSGSSEFEYTGAVAGLFAGVVIRF